MFHFETAIAEWRRQMSAGGIKDLVVLDELESHLREEVEWQMRSGMNGPRAFEAAVQKIGPAGALKNEFRKVQAAREERAWAIKQKMIIIGTSLLSLAMAGVVLFKSDFSQMTLGQQLSGLTAIAAFSFFVWSGRFGYRMFPVIRTKRTRDVISNLGGVPVLLWWFAFVFLILPRYDFTLSQFEMVFLWGFWAPGGIVIGFTWGIETAARKNIQATELVKI